MKYVKYDFLSFIVVHPIVILLVQQLCSKNAPFEANTEQINAALFTLFTKSLRNPQS